MPGGVQTYYLRGGPCDKTTGDLPPNQGAPNHIDCGGDRYIKSDPIQRINGALLYNDHGPVPPPGPPAKSAKAHGGWHDVRVSINQHMPKALRASHHNTQAALRSLSRARKVRL